MEGERRANWNWYNRRPEEELRLDKKLDKLVERKMQDRREMKESRQTVNSNSATSQVEVKCNPERVARIKTEREASILPVDQKPLIEDKSALNGIFEVSKRSEPPCTFLRLPIEPELQETSGVSAVLIIKQEPYEYEEDAIPVITSIRSLAESDALPSQAEAQQTVEVNPIRQKTRRRLWGNLYWKNNESQDSRKYQCCICNKAYSSSVAAVFHFESVHLNMKYKCDICNVAEFTRKALLSSHKKTCGKGGATCELCGKKYRFAMTLKVHKDVIHFGKRFQCQFCDKMYRSRRPVYIHEKKCPAKEAANST